MALKYSRQRESIKKYLSETKDHPTADMVYTNIRKHYPNISLGTVYRNLNLLVDQGDVIKVTTGDGSDRFDGNIDQHYHFLCTECSTIEDIYIDSKLIERINEFVASDFKGSIHGHNSLFHGLCHKCQQNKKQTEK